MENENIIRVKADEISSSVLCAFCEFVEGANPDFIYKKEYLLKNIPRYIMFQEYVNKICCFFETRLFPLLKVHFSVMPDSIRVDETVLFWALENSNYSVNIVDRYNDRISRENIHRFEIYYDSPNLVLAEEVIWNINKDGMTEEEKKKEEENLEEMLRSLAEKVGREWKKEKK